MQLPSIIITIKIVSNICRAKLVQGLCKNSVNDGNADNNDNAINDVDIDTRGDDKIDRRHP